MKTKKAKENFTENHGLNILRLFDVLPNLASPQVKRSAIISNKHGIQELSHELLNDLRLSIGIRKYQENIKTYFLFKPSSIFQRFD